MRDWILGLQKAALDQTGGVSQEEWDGAEHELGGDAPEELRDLYLALNGATFASGVVLFPLVGPGEPRGVLGQTRSGTAGLPTEDIIRFGRKDTLHLAAMRKHRLSEVDQAEAPPPPDWLEELSDDGWVFLARDENTRSLRLYRTLEQLLTSMIPPAQSEEFGETTLARAKSLVEAAVAEIDAARERGVEKLTTTVSSAKAMTQKAIRGMKKAIKARVTKKKKPKAAARKAPAKKAAKKAPAKKTAGKKAAAPKRKATSATKKRRAASKR